MGNGNGRPPWQGQMVAISFLLLGTQDFAARLIGAAQRGEKIDQGALDGLREACVLATKNSETIGFSMEDDAQIIRESAEALDKLLQSTIAWGRKRAD